MAEYKNGVNFRGNMSVEADDISPEVKTGRVVFVDEDLYESNEAYKAKVDKCVEEGFMRSDEAGSGGGSGGSSGGGASGLVVNTTEHSDEAREYFDKTWNEVKTAVANGQTVYVHHYDIDGVKADYYEPITSILHSISDNTYSINVGYISFNCGGADDYPYYYYGD